MTGERANPATTTGSTKPRPPVGLQAPVAKTRLNAELLALVRRRKLEQSVLPGVPFH
jgi:hypothetical protein